MLLVMMAGSGSMVLNGQLKLQAPSRVVRECATCHPAESTFHPSSSMAQALETVSECKILTDHAALSFVDGKYLYRIERHGDSSIYSVTDGGQTVSAPIAWAFGRGVLGQTYVFEIGGQLYQSRVSYFAETQGLDITIGAGNLKPGNLMEAAGQRMSEDDKTQCFGCHATNAIRGKALSLDTLVPGVQCERCHGESQRHLDAVRRNDVHSSPMRDLRKLSTEELSNFCGQCHRSWEDIAGHGPLGINNVRFQPYRLTNSKCYDTEDARISCVACHNPHQEIDRIDIHYDRNCQTCHGGGGAPAGKVGAKVCKVASSNCISCHMPKIGLRDSHHKFTDHQIRIVRANAPYPN